MEDHYKRIEADGDVQYVRCRPSYFRKKKATMRNMDGTYSTYDPTKPHEVQYVKMGGLASSLVRESRTTS
jgi:hypothetical protein